MLPNIYEKNPLLLKGQDEEDYDFYNYGYDATVDSVLDNVYDGRSDLEILNDVNATCIGDFAEALELFNKVNKTNHHTYHQSTDL